ncbi:PIN domain-containing protein [Neobacillus drentensis]|uniref:PIN domain-containing protein n=1 Tax=Neobacillus drentensis TaxID=220684 RepID=UPI0030031655
MNIFLDTTVFHNGKDVFMNSLYNKILLNICRQNGFKIYISNVVLMEARRQYEKFITTHVKNISNAVGAFNLIPNMRRINLYIPPLEEALKRFDSFFSDLEKEGTVVIVNYSNDILPTLINRAINRIKPFTEEKQEFRDAIIWLSYVGIAENQDLNDCLFVTANTKDYCSKDKKLHPELAADSERFTLFVDSHSLVQSDFLKSFKETHDLLGKLREKKWTSEELLVLLNDPPIFSNLEIEIGLYFTQFDVTGIELKRARVLSIEYISGDFIVRGFAESIIQGVDGPLSNDLDIVFECTYNPEENKFINLTIENINDNEEGEEYLGDWVNDRG